MSNDERARLLLDYMDRLREKYPSAPSDKIRAKAEELVAKKLGQEHEARKPHPRPQETPNSPPPAAAVPDPIEQPAPSRISGLLRSRQRDRGTPESPPKSSPAQVIYVQQSPRFRGPPHDCRDCGGPLRKGRKATGTASGCLMIVLGLVLCLTGVGLIFGIPILLVGIYLGSKAEGFFQCRSCHQKFPRRIRWFEPG